jgi:hypothetical protein
MADFRRYLKALLYLRRRRARPDTYGHQFGVLVAFLTGAVGIRFGGNIFVMLDLAARREYLGWGSFLTSSLGVLAAYGVTVLPLSSYRYLHDFLKHPRLRSAPFSRKTKTAALACSVFFRPTAITVFILAALTAVLSVLLSTDSVSAALPLTIFLCMTLLGAAAVIAVVYKLRLDRANCEYLEIGFLAVILLSNFDIRVTGSQGELIFFMNHLPEWPAALSTLVLPAVLLILAIVIAAGIRAIEAAVSGISRLPNAKRSLIRARASFPVELYVKRSKLWLWIAAYGLIIPTVTSVAAPSAVKRWFIALFLIFGFTGFIRMAAMFETEVAEKLLFRFTRKHRLKLFTAPFLIHLVLSIVPVLIWIIAS